MINVYELIHHSWNATYREGKQKQFDAKLKSRRWADNKWTKTKNAAVPRVFPTFSCKWLQFTQVCVIFTQTPINTLHFIYTSHHQGVAENQHFLTYNYYFPVWLALFMWLLWDVQICLKTRTCSCLEHLRSIKMMLYPMSMMSHTQEAESPVVTVTVVHNILKWEIM